MKIMSFLDPKCVVFPLKSKEKKAIIRELIEVLAQNNRVKDKEEAFRSVMKRENIGSTGVGSGVAIPHGRCSAVDKLVGAIGISPEGVDFNSLDGEPVHFVFLILSPLEATGDYLRAISAVARFFKDRFFRESLKNVSSAEEAIKIIKQEDSF
ncbi:MAG: PTS sugar transporter subunit IIA [Elusimicrobiota bacterium]|nr:PTS sugar transporter subunit IIA [Endomicrobiia bacterium]MCX7910667.1 PTS sugar transporter subunit IIA [Endomicrobiia bacterium]MDW8164985.1 PTS sugar transporter subunit IIA [Elusimicrobiota bacterium]